ncbi:DUF2752 domain-containing protein [Sabulilitoribacter arenilitoris]|uniref:DUF2752 domain-containing protein n=1 Tax=Wocania arenilitoris TaxID=2044858 RepID=A0AAE3EPK6_9FLAO|nr:DUF2752 domain-containing protein [Wocania arenilitoris]MCF7569311.1 DUF2752 domain-containing protein [Wocania arenilitoris]
MQSTFEEYMVPCLNKKLFGIDCMGCGMQRSISLIFYGDFVEAFYMYPAIYTLILLFGVIAINSFKSFKYANKIIIILAILNAIIIIGNFIIKTFLIK